MSIEKKVERWAIRLDISKPDWYENVNLYIIDLASNRRCVIGQAFGNYMTSEDARRFRRTWIPFWRFRWGHLTPHPFYYASIDKQFRARDAWQSEVEKRRNAPAYDGRRRLVTKRTWITKTETPDREELTRV